MKAGRKEAVITIVFLIVVFAYSTVFSLLTFSSRQTLRTEFGGSVLYLSPGQPTNDAETLGINIKSINSLSEIEPKYRAELKSDTSTLPILFISDGKKIQAYSGWPTIKANIAPALARLTSLSNGKLAVIGILLLACSAFAYRREISPWTPAVTLFGLGLMLALPSTCSSCQSLMGAFFGLAPLVISGFYVFVIFLLYLVNSARYLYAITAGASIILISGQCILLVLEPKLCPICVITGGIMVSILLTSLQAFLSKNLIIISGSSLAGKVTVGCSIMVLFSQVAYATGKLQPPMAKLVQSQNFAGQSIRSLIQPKKDHMGKGIYLITRSGCPACEYARAGFRSKGVIVFEIPTCTILSGEPCFSESKSFSTPLILLVNERDEITLSYEGWPSSPEGQTEMYDQLNRGIWKEKNNENHK